MILFRSRIRRDLEELIESIPGEDPDEAPFHILDLLTGASGKIKHGDLKYLHDSLEQFTFLGPICILRSMLSPIVARSRELGRRVSTALGTVYRLFSEIYNANTESIQAYFLQALKHDSMVLAVGYTRSLASTLLYARSKINTLYALEGYPLRPGKMLAVELRRAGVKSYHIPDEMAYWASSSSNVTVIPVYGVSRAGWLTSDASSVIAAYTSKESGVEVIGLALPMFTCSASKDSALPHKVMLTREVKSQDATVRFPAYEHLDPSVLDRLVTHEGVLVEPSSSEISEAASAGSEEVSRLVEDMLSREGL